MKYYSSATLLIVSALLLVGCGNNNSNPMNTDYASNESQDTRLDMARLGASETNQNDPSTLSKKGFTHGPTVSLDEGDYYFAGPPDGPGGARDIPGHYWSMAGPTQLVGKHYNTGPFGAPSWWSSDAGDGELLYIVHAIIDTWTPQKAQQYASRGYIHYHELVHVSSGELHPYLVVWLKHTARAHFTLDGGPHPEDSHEVSPGVDLEFIPNGSNPYNP